MDILTFPPDYWNGPRHNRHYFCEELSKSNRVLFVSPPFYLVDLIQKFGKGMLPKSGLRQVNRNLLTYIHSKTLFTNHRFPRLNELMRRMRVKKIRAIMKKWGFKRPVILIWHPKFMDMIGQFDESIVVYYVYDQYSGYVGGDPTRPDEREIELLKKADIAFTLTKELYEDKKKWAKEIYHLPNAVDYDLFATAREPNTLIPSDISKIPKPIIGYIGTINEKVDIELLHHVTNVRPNWSIVLIGRENYTIEASKRQFEMLILKPNVYWLGPKPYDSVPSYIKGLDVCMMCYVINEWTYFGDPSKMHEYLASGKPTIGVGLPAIRKFSDVIMVPESQDGWIEAIEMGLNENDPRLVEKRIETARQNSYQYRTRFATDVIKKRIATKERS